jgi:hypothetical protein
MNPAKPYNKPLTQRLTLPSNLQNLVSKPTETNAERRDSFQQ